MEDVKIDSFKKEGVSYYRLYIKCPICNQQGRETPPSFWYHESTACDNGEIYVGDNAFYMCKDCGHTKHIMNWRYWCQHHSKSDNDYVELTDKSVYADVVAAAGQIVKAAGIPWLTELLKNL